MILQKMLRRSERIAKWESNRVEPSWSAGFEYRRFAKGWPTVLSKSDWRVETA
jgi:hypothetical protein